MEEREKVISGLTHCAEGRCEGCPYRPAAHEDQLVCMRGPILDAERLLREGDDDND